MAGTGSKPTHLDLFSGIGGFALAAQWAGFRTIGFCEIDGYCQKVLAKNFNANAASERRERCGDSRNWRNGPENIYPDIFELDGTAFQGVSLITGGFPCQPFSVAGKRGGANDDRAIWPEMFRVIKEARPAWVLGENVPGIIPMELDNVLSDLEGIGYATRAFVIPACAVDARHRRDRVWIVCNTTSPRLPNGASVSLGGRGELQPKSQRSGCEAGNGSGPAIWFPEPDVGRVVDGLSLELDFARQINAHEYSHRWEKKSERNILVWKLLRAMWEHRELATTSPELYVEQLQRSVPELPLRDTQSLQFKLFEQVRSAKREQTMGNRVNRLKGLGNAIVPQVAYEILREIRKLC